MPAYHAVEERGSGDSWAHRINRNPIARKLEGSDLGQTND